jgi:hypothetical protein
MDRLLGALREQLGAPAPGRPTYYLLEGELTEYDTPCPSEAYACADGSAAYTRIAPLDHEIVHLARSAVDFSHPLLEEGAAEYWGDDADIRGPVRGDVLDIATRGSEVQFPSYPRAGHFVAYLVETYGETAFFDVSARTRFDSTVEELSGALVEVYGMDLEMLVEDYEAIYPECPQVEYRAAIGECAFAAARPLCDAIQGPLVIRRRFSCGDEDVLGPRLGRLWTTIPVDVPEAGLYNLVFEASPAAGVELKVRRCDGGCGSTLLGPLAPSETVRLGIFEAGHSVIEMEWPEGEAIDVELEIFGGCG